MGISAVGWEMCPINQFSIDVLSMLIKFDLYLLDKIIWLDRIEAMAIAPLKVGPAISAEQTRPTTTPFTSDT